MKILLSVLLLFMVGCAKNTCLWHRAKETIHVAMYRPAKQSGPELIYMGGVSTQSKSEFTEKVNHFLRIDTKEPRVRTTRGTYGKFEADMLLDANSDTGDDRLRIFAGDSLIYSILFHDGEQKVFLCFSLRRESRLRFVVDNLTTLNNTPGAFAATIKLKMN